MTTTENILLHLPFTLDILTLYLHYTNTEGKSASWRSRVCDEG